MRTRSSKSSDVCASGPFERNNYFYDKEMTSRDFVAEQSYHNRKRWLINRTIHGWGVVCGLGVNIEGDCLRLEDGVALDCMGREIVVCCHQGTSLAKLLRHVERDADEVTKVVCLEFCETGEEPVDLPGGCCDDQETQYNRWREHFRLTLRDPSDVCCCDEEQVCPLEHKATPLQRLLCRALSGGCPRCGKCVDCVPLGELHVSMQAHDPYKPPQLRYDFDPCSCRRLVYNNQLLFDLIRCHHGDLPRITDVNWRDYHNTGQVMGWNDFVNLLENGMKVDFLGDIDPDTLNCCSVLLTVVIVQHGTGSKLLRRVPLTLSYSGQTLLAHVESSWRSNEIENKHTDLAHGFDAEFVCRGSLVRARNGKALDGEPLGFPSGNGVQGGDFLSCFQVGARP